MSATRNIIFNEFKKLLRGPSFIITLVFFLLTLSIVVYLGIIQNKNQQLNQVKAQQHVRSQWESLEAMNPHRAAHYGSYAFKPMNALYSIDSGINEVTGNVIRLEGHVQNEIIYSEASQSIAASKFGKLKTSLLLQYIIPLFIIFFGFGSMVREREKQRLKLVVFQGVSIAKLAFGKSIAVWLYGLILLTFTVFVQCLFSDADAENFQRLSLLVIAYGLYYYVIASLTTYLSARLKDKSSALSSILAVWILWTIFLPKIWGNTAEKIHQLPSRKTFKESMREERSRGIDGHNPRDKRREKLKEKYLAEYKVDSLKNLPLNFDGIVMQEDEEYGNLVWDKYFGYNYDILREQKLFYQISGFLNPFASLQSASMGFSGTDMVHHLDFLKESENYRRYMVKTLNDAHAYGGSKTGDWKWTVDETFFKSVNDFTYDTPRIANHIHHYFLDLFFLTLWALVTSMLIRLNANKFTII
tara:strand:- start:887 stop:2299 length:1413 start_codon:yes stop_codon:yes gene_type:complete